MPKKILIVDDSALMRRVLCDIIDADYQFEVKDRATNGIEAFDLLSRNQYDAVVLDVNMPKLNGLQLLAELKKYKIKARVMMVSTYTKKGAAITLEALELGALDFVQKPDDALQCREGIFQETFLRTLKGVSESNYPIFETAEILEDEEVINSNFSDVFEESSHSIVGDKIVAIASSTGGPKALQAVIPRLPRDLDAPVLVVQHMPKGFTASLAARLNSLSKLKVVEAAEGMEPKKGNVYIAPGGKHLNVVMSENGTNLIHLSDEPPREGVKPCANYMYESLINSRFDNIVCVVMTGMGADGTEGIRRLKEQKNIHVISQSQDTCTIYGMPRSIVREGLSDEVVALDDIAQEIIIKVGISK